jgi:hypothetical protein
MHNDKYPPQPFKFTPKDTNLNSTFKQTKTQKHIWVTFTYTGKEIRPIKQLFRNTNLKISYRTNNTIQSLLTEKPIYMDKYSASGIYKLK